MKTTIFILISFLAIFTACGEDNPVNNSNNNTNSFTQEVSLWYQWNPNQDTFCCGSVTFQFKNENGTGFDSIKNKFKITFDLKEPNPGDTIQFEVYPTNTIKTVTQPFNNSYSIIFEYDNFATDLNLQFRAGGNPANVKIYNLKAFKSPSQ